MSESKDFILKSRIKDWTDIDIAMYYLGESLGIFPADDPLGFPVHYKYHTNGSSPVGDKLYDMLRELIGLGAVEEHADEPQVRWTPGYEVDGYFPGYDDSRASKESER